MQDAPRESEEKFRKLFDAIDEGLAIVEMIYDEAGEIVTGLVYLERDPTDLHDHLDLVATPLNALADRALCPGAGALDRINARLR